MQDEMTNKMFNKVLNVLSVEVIQTKMFFVCHFFSWLLKDVEALERFGFCCVLTSCSRLIVP